MVYPSHRTAAYPERIYEMTLQNAQTGELLANGDGVAGVAEGFPFPFPRTAEELMWNHKPRYKGTGSERNISLVAPTLTASARRVAASAFFTSSRLSLSTRET